MIPQRRPDQSFEQHQFEMAVWAGYDTTASLNREHDPLHRAICAFLGVTSHAMREAAGEALTAEEAALAVMEEQAILLIQRFLNHARKGPKP